MKPKERMTNKIAFCWGCFAPLTGDKTMFCTETCAATYGKRQSNRDLGWVKVWVYCNKAMLNVAIGEGIWPHEMSAFIHTGNDMTCVALFDQKPFFDIPDSQASVYDAYYREIAPFEAEASLEPHNPTEMRDEGILSYLCDHFGIRTERDIARAIPELVRLEGLKDPIELFNTL
jgi:hypothetical protein